MRSDTPATVLDDEPDIEELESNGGNDEEVHARPQYSWLAAYSAYRYGMRAWAVTTKPGLDNPVWRDPGDPWQQGLIVRDIDLQFPGTGADSGLEDITTWEGWEKSPWVPVSPASGRRVWIRALSSHPSIYKSYSRGEADRLGQWVGESGLCYLGIPKPVNSIFLVADIMETTGDAVPQTVISEHFFPDTLREYAGRHHHAPPAGTSEIASSLIRRSENWAADREGARTPVLGALMAGEAYELLFGLGRTTVLRALTVLHKAEVATETRFLGITALAHLKRRREDLVSALESLIPSESQVHIRENYFVKILSVLRTQYLDTDQLEAADIVNTDVLLNKPWLLAGQRGMWSVQLLNLWRWPTSNPSCGESRLTHRPLASWSRNWTQHDGRPRIGGGCGQANTSISKPHF